MEPLVKRVGSMLLVTAAGVTGGVQAHEWQINEDTSFSVGGSIEIAYINEQRVDGNTGKVDGVRELIDNGSTLAFSGEHTFYRELTAFFHAEFEFKGDEAEGGPAFETDEAYFGVRGNFGTVQIGDWDGVYEDNVEDLLDVFEVSEPTNSEDFRTGEVGDAIAYMSPEYKGFSFAVQAFLKGEGEGENFDNDSGAEDGQAFQAVIKYETDTYGVYLGYDNNGLDHGGDGTFGIGASLDLDSWTFAAKIESVGEDSDPVSKLDAEGYMLYGMAVSYDYGPGNITGAINQVEPGSSAVDSRTEFGVNLSYYLADSFYIYAEHFRYDRENDLDNITAVGLVYEF